MELAKEFLSCEHIKPLQSDTISRTPPESVVTTGLPSDIASATVSPNVSSLLDETKASCFKISLMTSFLERPGKKVIESSN